MAQDGEVPDLVCDIYEERGRSEFEQQAQSEVRGAVAIVAAYHEPCGESEDCNAATDNAAVEQCNLQRGVYVKTGLVKETGIDVSQAEKSP